MGPKRFISMRGLQMERTVLVSIIMPAYNSEAHITEAITSVLEQTYSQWELIISDDHSSDSTRAIAETFAEADNRILVITSDARSGPARARNRAISLAKGRWLAFLDSDDYWEPDKLRATIEFAQKSDGTLTFTGYRKLTEPSKKIGNPFPVSSSVTYFDLLKSNQITTSTVVIDRDRYPNFAMREDVFFDDYVAWLAILKDGHTAMSLPAPLTVYRTGRTSFSSNKVRAAKNVMKIYREVEGLNFPLRCWYFANYALRGILKTFR